MPSTKRLFRLANEFQDCVLDPRPYLLALPMGKNVEAQQHTDSLQDTGDVSSRQIRGFYQESDIAQLLSFAEASEKRESEATLRKVLTLLQRWVNSDPRNHTRRVLFEVLLIERLNLGLTMAYDFVTGTHLPLHAGKNKFKGLNTQPLLKSAWVVKCAYHEDVYQCRGLWANFHFLVRLLFKWNIYCPLGRRPRGSTGDY